MTIEERLEKVERELCLIKRRNHWLWGTVLLVAGGLVLPAVLETKAFREGAQVAGGTKESRASSFLLVDENGKPRAGLILRKNRPGLALWDDKDRPRVQLILDENGPMLMLSDENQKNRVALIESTDGPVLSLRDEKGQSRAALMVMKDGPRLVLFDENSVIRLMAGRSDLGSSIGTRISYPESSIVLFGPDGKVTWSVPKIE